MNRPYWAEIINVADGIIWVDRMCFAWNEL